MAQVGRPCRLAAPPTTVGGCNGRWRGAFLPSMSVRAGRRNGRPRRLPLTGHQRAPMGGRGGRWGDEHGQVAIVVALMLVVLLGFAALVVDVGLNWAARTQAQAAADAAALAGVIALPSDPTAAVEDVRHYLNANVPGLAGTHPAGNTTTPTPTATSPAGPHRPRSHRPAPTAASSATPPSRSSPRPSGPSMRSRASLARPAGRSRRWPRPSGARP